MVDVSFRPFLANDLFRYDIVNVDPFTENFHIQFYLNYLIGWPECCFVATSATGDIIGYVLGKTEGVGEEWHVHVTAITVCPEYRGTGVARTLLTKLERTGKSARARFCDLYVRIDNAAAVQFYRRNGYYVHQKVEDYYPDGLAAFDMRKNL
ncbi:MAG: uncharacterized protein KVP18_000417 [Porospora cf. gigantea A]|uniref:uncharacterized protein n=1 Tax=Porospora cf. gigantea A TaxID=2853593 RepID=UPI003559A310|nr:MAG: hypothetical protein KVP18_000417 [Porospora cf. gigantea A]